MCFYSNTFCLERVLIDFLYLHVNLNKVCMIRFMFTVVLDGNSDSLCFFIFQAIYQYRVIDVSIAMFYIARCIFVKSNYLLNVR